jgi:hypothetical protein
MARVLETNGYFFEKVRQSAKPHDKIEMKPVAK